MPSSRPEFEAPPDVLFNAAGAERYTRSRRVQWIQRAMTLRALELLALPSDRPAFLLDVGCGSGLSGAVLRERGHTWVGVDLSSDMLAMAKSTEGALRGEDEENNGNENGETIDGVNLQDVRWGPIPGNSDDESDGDGEDSCSDSCQEGLTAGPPVVEVLRGDMGEGLPFRPGSFDGAVSISAVQWLCQSDRRGQVPQRRLRALFQCLYNGLRRGAKAALQFYPANVEQLHMITRAAMLCGFSGGVVVDFPHSAKAKKHYLVVQAGQVAGGFVPPAPLSAKSDCDGNTYEEGENGTETEEDEECEEEEELQEHFGARVGGRVPRKHPRSHNGKQADRRRRKDNRPVTGSKDWVLLKKAERRKFGLKTSEDTKYTMRRRRPRF
uniref:Uncharacterized protein n=1 Tax=Trypanosoma congolense (strain IL3000) TaxID=1068625 RepID=G0UL18_TRYCI|nr:conserved hypothetical protein [Trypanosoma congolense IL3000]